MYNMSVNRSLVVLEKLLSEDSKAVVDAGSESSIAGDSKYYYTAGDFVKQDYVVVSENLIQGSFMVALKTAQGVKVGWISWDVHATFDHDHKTEILEAHEHIIVSIGDITMVGAGLHASPGGFYKEGTVHTNTVSGACQSAMLTVENIGDGVRMVQLLPSCK